MWQIVYKWRYRFLINQLQQVLEQSIYDRGLSSDLRLPDIAFGNFRLRDALRSDFRSLADPEGIAWPEGYQTPQKLAIVVYVSHSSLHFKYTQFDNCSSSFAGTTSTAANTTFFANTKHSGCLPHARKLRTTWRWWSKAAS